MTEQEGQVEQIGIIVVHGVSDVEPGVNSRTLARNVRTVLRQSGSDAPPVARAPFEVHQLDNPTPGREFGIHREDFQAYLTTMQVEAGPHLTFAEVYWADTTRSVPGKLSTFLDLIRSVFEFHGLFDAMIERSRSRREDLLARFLHLGAWLVRGPLAGLQTAAIVTGLLTCLWFTFARIALPIVDHGSLGHVTSIAAICWAAFAAWRVWRGKSTASITWLEVMIYSIPAALLILIYAQFWLPKCLADVQQPEATCLVTQLEAHYGWIRWLWAGVSMCVIAAVILTAVATASAKPQSLVAGARNWGRTGGATTLLILQCALVLLIASPPAFALIGWVNLFNPYTAAVESTFSVYVLNVVALLAFAGGMIYALRRRAVTARAVTTLEGLAKARGEQWRIIVPWLSIIVMTLMGLALHALHLSSVARGTDWLAGGDGFKGEWPLTVILGAAAVLLGLLAAIALLGLLELKVMARIVHIVRDLIDHHFQHPWFSIVRLLPRERQSSGTTPRRTRILGRMRAVEDLLIDRGCTRIVYAAHSQGTVIAFEHLKRVSAAAPDPRCRARSAVTFGSPLRHIYGQYFHAYDHLDARLMPIAAGLASWTNLYRLDDPIGAPITTLAGKIHEIPMNRGVEGTRFTGHSRYYAERAVAKQVLLAAGLSLGVGPAKPWVRGATGSFNPSVEAREPLAAVQL